MKAENGMSRNFLTETNFTIEARSKDFLFTENSIIYTQLNTYKIF